MTLKVTQGHRNCYDKIGHVSLLFVVCSNNISILDHFHDTTTFKVYVTAGDLEKSFSFDKTVEITSQIRCATFPEVHELGCGSMSK